MLHAGRNKPACTYCMQRHSNATHRATRRQPRQATDFSRVHNTIDGQAHLNLARPRQYRAWVSLYTRILPLMYSLALRFVSTCARPSLRIRIPSIIPLAILSRILAQSCVTLCLNYVGRVTHDCASILDSIAKGISLFPRFFAWCIPTSIFIHFYTCSTYFSRINICSYAYKRS